MEVVQNQPIQTEINIILKQTQKDAQINGLITQDHQGIILEDAEIVEENSESYNSESDQCQIQQTIEQQLKVINPNLIGKPFQKSQFTKNISNLLQDFFNPFIDQISKKQRQCCQKLGLKIIKTQEQQKKEKLALLKQSSANNTKNNPIINTSLSKRNSTTEQNRQKTTTNNSIQYQRIQIQKESKSYSNNSEQKPVQKVTIKRNSEEQKKLIKQMQQKFNVKFRNNRLYMKGMPRKPVSSFFFFFKDYSKQLHDLHQHVQVSKQLTYGSALAKRISQKWRQMTTQQKLPYKKMSQKTRQQYRKSMQDFKSQNNEVYQSFKRIKRIKANQTRRIKIQKDNAINQSLEIQEQEQQNSQSQSQRLSAQDKQPQKSNQTLNIPVKQQAHTLSSLTPSKNDQVQERPINNHQIKLQQKQFKTQHKQQAPKKAKQKRNRKRACRQRFKSLHKPKSPSPSFFFYYNQKKQFISKQYNVNTGAQITKYASILWKTMSDQQKRPYQILADQRRKKYYEDMKSFEFDYPEQWAKMMEYRRRGMALYKQAANKKIQQQQQKQNRQAQQDNSQSDNQDYNEENSQSSRIESPQIDSLEGTIIKKQPKKQQKSSKTKIQPAKKQIIEKKPIQTKAPPAVQKNTSKVVTKKKLKQKPPRPKAPVSSFFMFYKDNNAAFSQQFKQAQGGKLVQYASAIWKNMSDEQKKPYQIQAQQSRQKYYKQMEEYKQKYPQQVKKRRQDLKKKHKQQQEGLSKTKRKRRTKTQMQQVIKQKSVPGQNQNNSNTQIKVQQSEQNIEIINESEPNI